MISALLLSGALALSGCGNRAADNGDQNRVQPNSNAADGVGTNNLRIADNQRDGGNDNNSRMEMSQRIADKLTAMPGIDAAYVMLTDRNAYVAIMQDRQGTNGSGKMGAKGNNGGSRNGRVGSNAANNGSDIASGLKDRIANRVKAMAPSVENVYVTANPDFVTRMQRYAQDIANGHPIRGLADEFNSMVRRMFPQASGTNGSDGGRAGTTGGSRTSGIGGLND